MESGLLRDVIDPVPMMLLMYFEPILFVDSYATHVGNSFRRFSEIHKNKYSKLYSNFDICRISNHMFL